MNSLEDIFKKHFWITLEESWEVETSPGKSKDKIWYEQVELNRNWGVIYLVRKKRPAMLACHSVRIKQATKAHNAHPDTTKLEILDGECILYFRPKEAIEIAKTMGGKRRRVMTKEAKDKLRKHLNGLVETGVFTPYKKKETLPVDKCGLKLHQQEEVR